MANIANIVNVTITRETRTVSQVGFGTPLILGPNGTFGVNTVRSYEDISAVAVDFAPTDDEFRAATAVFAQNPSPVLLKIAVEAPRVAQVQTFFLDADLVAGNTITVDVDAVTVFEIFATSHIATMTAFAASIQAEPGVATAVFDGTRTITITAATPGVAVILNNEGITGGASQAGIVIATTVANVGPVEDLTAIILDDDDFFALVLTDRDENIVRVTAGFIETLTKIFITASSDIGILDSADTEDIASVLANANRDRTAVIFNETTSDFIDAAWLGKVLPDDPGSVTWKFKTLSGPTVSSLNATERSDALNKNANLYTEFAGIDMMEEGTMASGEFIDIIRGTDFLQARLAEDIFGKLVNAKKIPFTDAGIAIIEAAIRARLDNSIAIGLITPDPETFDGQPYIVTVPRAFDVSDNDKGNRLLPDVEFQATLAGAIHKVVIQGVVSI